MVKLSSYPWAALVAIQLLVRTNVLAFGPAHPRFQSHPQPITGKGSAGVPSANTRTRMSSSTVSSSIEQEEYLYDIARKLKLEIIDLDEELIAFESKDPKYGLEAVSTWINVGESDQLGIELTEMAHGESTGDGRGLCLISGLQGNAAKADPPLQVGDVITYVASSEKGESVTAFDYDTTVEKIQKVKELVADGVMKVEVNRLVPRASVVVEVEAGDGQPPNVIHTLAGANLRRLLLQNDLKLYNEDTKRFDMPYATGDCAGEGICGTCLVQVLQGMETLNRKSSDELLITKGRPASWRAACRTVVGAQNEPCTLRVSLRPQESEPNEMNPGVKSVKRP